MRTWIRLVILGCVVLLFSFIARVAAADTVICGQWVRADCALGRFPVFVPCDSKDSWMPDPGLSNGLVREGEFVRLYDPNVGEGITTCSGYSSVRYLWGVSRYEYISDCSACSVSPVPTGEPYVSFTADRDTLDQGECATIRWTVDSGSSVILNGEGVGRHDSRYVCPLATTTYRLTATRDRWTSESALTITVRSSDPAVAISFSADSTSIAEGQCTTLRWNVSNAQWVSLDGQDVRGADSSQVCPKTTTDYTLRASGPGGSDARALRITVERPAIVDNVRFVSDVTVPDGTVLSPGEKFVKTWRLQNTGNTTWSTAYQFVFVGGDRMNAAGVIALPREVRPGQEIDISASLIAPPQPGHYRGGWRIRNSTRATFGSQFWVDILVGDATDASDVMCGQALSIEGWATQCDQKMISGTRAVFVPCRSSEAYLLEGASLEPGRFFRLNGYSTVPSQGYCTGGNAVTRALTGWRSSEQIDTCEECGLHSPGDPALSRWRTAVEHEGDSGEILSVTAATVRQNQDGTFTLRDFTLENLSHLCRVIRIEVNRRPAIIGGRDWALLMPHQRIEVPEWGPLHPRDPVSTITTGYLDRDAGAQTALFVCNVTAGVFSVATGQWYSSMGSSPFADLPSLTDRVATAATMIGYTEAEIAAAVANLQKGPQEIPAFLLSLTGLAKQYPGLFPELIQQLFGESVAQSEIVGGLNTALGHVGSGVKIFQVFWTWATERPVISSTTIRVISTDTPSAQLESVEETIGVQESPAELETTADESNETASSPFGASRRSPTVCREPSDPAEMAAGLVCAGGLSDQIPLARLSQTEASNDTTEPTPDDSSEEESSVTEENSSDDEPLTEAQTSDREPSSAPVAAAIGDASTYTTCREASDPVEIAAGVVCAGRLSDEIPFARLRQAEASSGTTEPTADDSAEEASSGPKSQSDESSGGAERMSVVPALKWRSLSGRWTGTSDSRSQSDSAISGARSMVDLPDATRYTIELRAQATAGREGFIIIFKYQGKYVWWNIGGWDNTSSMVEGIGKPSETQTDDRIVHGLWYKVKIDVDGDRAAGWLDGVQKWSIDRPAAQVPGLPDDGYRGTGLSGLVGLATWKTAAEFDDVQIIETAAQSAVPLSDGVTNVTKVNSEQEEHDTGIRVYAGDEIEIRTLSGEWSIWPPSKGGIDRFTGGAGQVGRACGANCPMPEQAIGALVGRIGTGTPFHVGTGITSRAVASGSLFLSINDTYGHFGDNGGFLIVSVKTVR